GTAAEAVPGFVALITHENMPRLARPEPGMQAGGAGFALSDLPYLQDDAVSWDGQPVAVVVAETLEDAEHAASLVRVEYEPAAEPAVSFDAEKRNAVTPESVLGEPPEVSVGDSDTALQQAAVRVDQTYRTPRYNHHAIEPHATVAWWDERGALTVYDTTQSVFRCKQALAQVFGLDSGAVRAIAAYVGGGFGGKAGLWSHTALCAAAAKVVRRPVKLSLTREQVVRVVGGRTVSEQRVALGADRRGRLAALIHEGLTATTTHGRYPEQLTFPARHLYKAQALRVRQEVVNLDMVANTWMRAPGESIGTFALESALDELAYELKLDPIELRRRNEPKKDPTEQTRFSSRNLVEMYRRGAEAFGWRPNTLPLSRREESWLIGAGVATAYYPYFRLGAKARVRISADGTATICAPANEMGMGTATVQIQHAAERLSFPVERVSFEYGDSALVDTKIMAGGSSQTVSVVAAVDAAIDKVLRELLRLAKRHADSPLHGLKYKDVVARDGGLYRADAPDRGESVTAILRRAKRDEVEVEAASDEPKELEKYSMGSYGAQFCEVRVHERTGEIRVARWVGAFDCGRILNRKTAESQLRGGIVMGIGMALTEETQFDERRGRIMTRSLADYHVPVNLDVPEIEVLFLDEPDKRAVGGAHGIGELGITGAAAAIANAVFNATGRRIRELPITLDRLA
ncbi:MAG TPA: xanthine dehydrogenase family protein molybdopterin-binding subunit, partial [Gammaproteobacteria bacterium]|nr:xanthine dehydrogenase family protein molybdopterin-binding subunit [Gammaproteobacteria bacterium]